MIRHRGTRVKSLMTLFMLPLSAAPLRYPLSPPDFFRLGSEWRQFFVLPCADMAASWLSRRSAAAVASTSLPALRNRSVGVKPPLIVKHWGGGGCFQTLGWKEDKTQTLGVSRLLPLVVIHGEWTIKSSLNLYTSIYFLMSLL